MIGLHRKLDRKKIPTKDVAFPSNCEYFLLANVILALRCRLLTTTVEGDAFTTISIDLSQIAAKIARGESTVCRRNGLVQSEEELK